MTEIPELVDTTESAYCTHAVCNCSVSGPIGGEAYCSAACQNADTGGIESDTCPCGHPECDVP